MMSHCDSSKDGFVYFAIGLFIGAGLTMLLTASIKISECDSLCGGRHTSKRCMLDEAVCVDGSRIKKP